MKVKLTFWLPIVALLAIGWVSIAQVSQRITQGPTVGTPSSATAISGASTFMRSVLVATNSDEACALLNIPPLVGQNGLITVSSNVVSLDTNLYVQTVTSSATNHVLNVTNLVNLLQVTNDVHFLHATNLCAGAQGQLLMRGDSTNRTLSFNSSWKFLGAAAPTSLASNKVANLCWIVLGTDQTNVICGYAVQP